MAASKLDLPEDLLPSSILPDEAAWTSGKDALAGGNNEDKALLDLVDESKDQMASENIIPLSPQWLYAKPTESKPGLFTAAGEARQGNSSAFGTLPDSAQKDVWRLDGSQDKKERRRNMPDVENNRSWREEERETSLLGRRERKKDDRESEYKKNERRPDIVSTRETSDSRSLLSSDRRTEVPNRTGGNESRRDSKWSLRWGPDEKDKDSRTEKKLDVDKEDSPAEKQSFFSSHRLPSDTDSRDKWRPRHRQELSGVSSAYRAAPGFGLEKGRLEGSIVGFAPGRGRSSSIPRLNRSSARPIGAEPLQGKSGMSLDTFRYPRAKLLDIYRKQKVTLFDNAPDSLEEVSSITESRFVTPLAFVTPDAEEEVLLKNIWKGKIICSEASYGSNHERMAKTNDHEFDAGDNIRNEREQDIDLDIGEGKDKTTMTNDISESPPPNVVDLGVSVDVKVANGNHITPGFKGDDLKIVSNDENLDMLKNANTGETSGIFFEVSAKLPDDTNDLFDASVAEQFLDTKSHESGLITKPFGQGASPEELSLYYQDPQGMVQGPFLGLDIISWFEDGFFGLDLPVCLSDAPEGTPFQPLGEVIPHLKLKLQSFPDINHNKGPEQLDTSSTIMEDNLPSDVASSLVTNNQQRGAPFNGLEHLLKQSVGENETPTIPQHDRISLSIPERRLVSSVEGQNYHDFSVKDSEEVIYMGRSLSNLEKQLRNPGDELINLPGSSSDQHYATLEAGDTSLLSQSIPRDSDLNPLGLLLSELKGNHPKHPLSSTIPNISNKSIMGNATVASASPFLQKHEQINVINDLPTAADVWSSNFRHSNSNMTPDLDTSHLSHFAFEPNQLSSDEHMLLQQIQKEQLQKQQLALQNLEFAGPFSNQLRGSMSHERSLSQPQPDLENLLKRQFEQNFHFEQMQQQLQLHQQQQNLRQKHMQILQQQHQQQQQQVLEQIMRQQLHDRGFEALNVDPRHANNMFDEVLLRQQLLHESQQPHHLPLHHDPAIEQIIKAKYGHNLNRENQYDFFDAIAHSKQRQMLPLEQQFLLGLQQEQFQARQFSRQQPVMDEDRHIGGLWSVDDSGQFIRTAASPHRNHPARANQLDVMQSQQRVSSFEQPSHLERNFLLHERMQQAQYEQGRHDLERLTSLHSDPLGSPMELANALSHLSGLGGHEHHHRLHSAGQVAQFSSSVHPHQRPTIDEFTGMHRDEMKQNFPDTERKRSLQTNVPLEDPHPWASQLANDGNSGHGVQEYFHQKMLQSHQPLGLLGSPPTSSIENRDSSWLYSHPGDGLGLNNSMEDASVFPKSGQPLSESLMNLNLEGFANSLDGRGRLPFRSLSAALPDQKQLLSDIDRIERQQFMNSMCGDVSMEGYASELRMGNMQNLKGISRGRSAIEMFELGTRQVPVRENEELKFNPPSRHASSGSMSSGGGVNFFGMGDNPPNEEMVNNRVSGDPVKVHIASSQPGVSDMTSAQPPKGKNPTISSNENKRDSISNHGLQSVEAPASNKKDLRFHITSSIGDSDVTEPTFIDMLKSTKKSMPEADAPGESQEAGAGKGSKKKGKKGRQIDPSLLGFKVHSNRILMGEIHRPDD